jgi:hypothetical protein
MQTDKETILGLETRFWQTVVDRNLERAKAMIADKCLIAGPSGTMQINPEKYGEMTERGQWRLDKFEFSDVSVVCPNESTAVIAYKVRQTGMLDDRPMDMNCADSSTWVRAGKAWKCVLHTETVLGQPH